MFQAFDLGFKRIGKKKHCFIFWEKVVKKLEGDLSKFI